MVQLGLQAAQLCIGLLNQVHHQSTAAATVHTVVYKHTAQHRPNTVAFGAPTVCHVHFPGGSCTSAYRGATEQSLTLHHTSSPFPTATGLRKPVNASAFGGPWQYHLLHHAGPLYSQHSAHGGYGSAPCSNVAAGRRQHTTAACGCPWNLFQGCLPRHTMVCHQGCCCARLEHGATVLRHSAVMKCWCPSTAKASRGNPAAQFPTLRAELWRGLQLCILRPCKKRLRTYMWCSFGPAASLRALCAMK